MKVSFFFARIFPRFGVESTKGAGMDAGLMQVLWEWGQLHRDRPPTTERKGMLHLCEWCVCAEACNRVQSCCYKLAPSPPLLTHNISAHSTPAPPSDQQRGRR